MRPKNLFERLQFVQDVVQDWRNRTKWYRQDQMFNLYPLTYGVIGLLEYIRDGDPNVITEPELRRLILTQLRRGYARKLGIDKT